jgi:hypothetical protein
MITASRIAHNLVSIFIPSSLFGSARTVYAHWDGTGWSLSSGRRPTSAMLDAIDRLPLSFDGVKGRK